MQDGHQGHLAQSIWRLTDNTRLTLGYTRPGVERRHRQDTPLPGGFFTPRPFSPRMPQDDRLNPAVAKLAVSVAGPLAKVATQHYFSKRREEVAIKRAQQQQDALQSVSGGTSMATGVTTEQRIDELIEQETCSTCQMALAELKDQPGPQMESGLRYYLEEYKPAKEAFDDGRITQGELQEKTEQLLDAAGL